MATVSELRTPLLFTVFTLDEIHKTQRSNVSRFLAENFSEDAAVIVNRKSFLVPTDSNRAKLK